MSSSTLQNAFQKLAQDAIGELSSSSGSRIIGLGSGSTVAYIVRELAHLPGKASIEVIPTSLQIKLEAEKSGLRIADENSIPRVDIVFDGADQIDSKFYMIKGGGGALLREKVLILAAKRVVIVADSAKFVENLNKPVPIEVHPFARSFVSNRLAQMSARPILRVLDKGYPFVTENGNLIIDAAFDFIADTRKKELELKSIPGVLEVGLFSRIADVYYKAKNDGSFEKIMP